MDSKRVLLFSYLCSRRALDDTVAFSIDELCIWSYMKTNRQEGKINQKYLELLNALSVRHYFIECPDFLQLSLSDVSTYYCTTVNTEKFDIQNSFGIIYFDELQQILNFKGELKDEQINLTRISSSYILLLLSYLRVNMNRDRAKPLCCYRMYQKISEDIGLSERYVGRIVEILDKLKIIKTKEAPRIKYKSKDGELRFCTSPKVFADYRVFIKDDSNIIEDDKYDCSAEIEKQIEKLKGES